MSLRRAWLFVVFFCGLAWGAVLWLIPWAWFALSSAFRQRS